jgi:AcrR family transcriptional regulator
MKTRPPVTLDGPNQDATRRQLLEAAGEVFAAAGFRAATVREICQRAGANVAAINYHFGDKETLYAEVLRYAFGKALEKYPPLLDVGENAPPEKRLHAFIHSLLLRIFGQGPDSWHGRLMSCEMIEPTAALDSLIEERIRLMSAILMKAIGEILNCPPTDDRVLHCAFSVMSQCAFYKNSNPAVSKLFPQLRPQDAAGIKKLANHITRFSLAAMKDFTANKK